MIPDDVLTQTTCPLELLEPTPRSGYRVELRASVVWFEQNEGLSLVLYARPGELPRSTAIGRLVDGTLRLVPDPQGRKPTPTYGGADYENLYLGLEHLGFDAHEPLLPVPVGATWDDEGKLRVERVDPSSFVPRRGKKDPRVERVLRWRAEGWTNSLILSKLPKNDRKLLVRYRAGELSTLDLSSYLTLLV